MSEDMNIKKKIDLSVLIPLYNERDNLRPLFQKITEVLDGQGLEWEVIFVDDGSDDGSADIISDLEVSSSRVKVVSLRRNFGKSAALDTGFQETEGKWVVIMDADLQDDPEEIPGLIEILSDGYDLVSGWRFDRQDRFIKKYTSRIYNWVTSSMSGIKLHDFNCGLKAMVKEVPVSISLYGELHRYIPVLAYWKGFRVTEKKVRHHPRAFGESKFGMYRFFAGFMDMLTVMFLTRYAKKPLHLFGGVGLILFVVGVLINGYLVMLSLLGVDFIRVRPLLFLGILLMLIGFQLISTGLLGEMMAMSLNRKKGQDVIRKAKR
jgi:glycosyltransferase involved in cell wall biosynthesis